MARGFTNRHHAHTHQNARSPLHLTSADSYGDRAGFCVGSYRTYCLHALLGLGLLPLHLKGLDQPIRHVQTERAADEVQQRDDAARDQQRVGR